VSNEKLLFNVVLIVKKKGGEGKTEKALQIEKVTFRENGNFVMSCCVTG